MPLRFGFSTMSKLAFDENPTRCEWPLDHQLKRLDSALRRLDELLEHVCVSERLLSRKEVARWAGCSCRTVDQWLREGAPHIRLGGAGGAPRMRASEIHSWLGSRRTIYSATTEASDEQLTEPSNNA